MWKRPKTQRVPPITASLLMLDHASYSPEVRGNGGLLFDELHAEHFRLNDSHFLIALEIALDQGRSRFIDLITSLYPEVTEQDVVTVLRNLWETELFTTYEEKVRQQIHQRSTVVRYSIRFLLSFWRDLSRAKPNRSTRDQVSSEPTYNACPPLLSLILEFVLTNVYYRASLWMQGWKHVVAPIRLAQEPHVLEVKETETVTDPPTIVEYLLAAALLAYGIPGVSALCAPVALTFYRMLRRRGYPCSLIIGSPPAPLWPHIWVELQGHVIDTIIYHYEESCYRPCSEIRTRQDILRVCGSWECCQRWQSLN